MRKSLAIGTILRSDDNVGSAITQSTLLRIGQWAQTRGVHIDFIPCMGAGKDLARAEVLAAYWHKSQCDDLLWIDNGNGIPGDWNVIWNYLDALMLSTEAILWGPYVVRGGERPSFACSLPGTDKPYSYLKTEKLHDDSEGEASQYDIRLLKLGGCGFGWTRMRREAVARVFCAYKDETFISNRLDSGLGELECVDVFSSLRRRRAQDTERLDRPVRLEPEDDSFWHRVRERGLNLWPYAMVDFPIAHGKTVGNFADYYHLDDARFAPSRILDSNGVAYGR